MEKVETYLQPTLLFSEVSTKSVVYRGDAYQVLSSLPSQICQTAITSPPYWGLRDYDIVFALIKAIVSGRIKKEGPTHLEVISAAGRIYRIEFSPDPDIAIRQVFDDGSHRNRIAIEIKGGTDFSNIHNRLGEAEKSHQKAKGEGFTQFWTVVNVASIEPSVWKQETPTTNELFYLGQITNVRSSEYARFKEYLSSELGI